MSEKVIEVFQTPEAIEYDIKMEELEELKEALIKYNKDYYEGAYTESIDRTIKMINTTITQVCDHNYDQWKNNFCCNCGKKL